MSAQVAPTLDLGLELPTSRSPGNSRREHRSARMATVIAIITAICLGALGVAKSIELVSAADQDAMRLSSTKLAEMSAMTVDDKSQIMAEGLSAEEKNAAIPVSTLPIERISGFKLGPENTASYASALNCLTQAVYYEAGAEPMQGRRAVAQVVLNRMRHPAFPKSVCGVVYQGSQLKTGCQFSFTCDGALTRAPTLYLWRQAQDVARNALAGYVETSVGTATHYHTDYVLPKWAYSLGKISQLGRHIFYRLPGNWGSALAFNGRYSGLETIPQIDLAALRLRADEDGTLQSIDEEYVPGLTVTPSVSDRHAPGDVGGRLDVTKQWRLNIPDPTTASSRYRSTIGVDEQNDAAAATDSTEKSTVAAATVEPKS